MIGKCSLQEACSGGSVQISKQEGRKGSETDHCHALDANW